ncbi:SGNH/GDSL hydrolase family protein [Streptomyces antimicrobicus]|uniref:SGNH/GDSL hydrolase family protein n=1 Tax=Streptomyces antimicrobicus TaxID=2883108 RepID=A0ABS8B597_9ACTN|nr:SGNH/GDSL hydrolase family protein [Streptomyces antimicrobicus]MCB5179790.1 SGNH/GDSL hydrolase family protein [Streptomyces antimicrobicus]
MSPSRSAVLAAATALAACLASVPPAAAATAPAATAPTAYAEYVALGDSYAAGAGIPRQSAGLCLRSDRNYPSVVAARLRPAVVRDVSCGAAKLDHLTKPQRYPVIGEVNAAQLDALTPQTRLVTMTLGGNDLGEGLLGMGEIVVKCVALAAVSPLGAPCRHSYGDSLTARIEATGPRLAAALQEIRRRSPRAKVVVTGYPSILPDNEWDCLFRQPVTVSDAAYLRDVIARLNAEIAARARADGATYADVHAATRGHDICQSPSQRWIEGILPHEPAMSVHPNARGEEVMAEAVLKAVR